MSIRHTPSIVLSLLSVILWVSEAPCSETGQPFFRSYSFEEIGNLSPGALLCSDANGMLWVSQQGTLLAFDNQSWTDMLSPSETQRNLNLIHAAPDGSFYYGAAGNWGRLRMLTDGTFATDSLRCEHAPSWTLNNRINHIAITPDGVAFQGQRGLVYYDHNSGQNHYFEIPQARHIFTLNDFLYVSSDTRGTERLDLESMELLQVQNPSNSQSPVITSSTQLTLDSVIAITRQGTLLRFDGEQFENWDCEIPASENATEAVLLRLDEHQLSFAHPSAGLFILNEKGHILKHLDSEPFRNISDMEVNEPGVLWISSGEGIVRLIYDYPVSLFDHRAGLSLSWPHIIRHQNETLFASTGKLYRPLNGSPGSLTRYEQWNLDQPYGIWTVNSTAHGLLIGNWSGLYFCRPDESITPVIASMQVSRIVQTDAQSTTFLILGEKEMTLIRWTGEQWEEISERVPSVGYPSVVHRTSADSVWVELGLNRVAHIQIEGEHIHSDIIDLWEDSNPQWIGIGNIGNQTVLSNGGGTLHFYDEQRKSFLEHSEYEAILRASPLPVQRVVQTTDGSVWIGYANGVYRLNLESDPVEYDTESLRLLRVNHPIFNVIGDTVWIAGEKVAYRIDPQLTKLSKQPPFPHLIRVFDARNNQLIAHSMGEDFSENRHIPYRSNSLTFHFFSGTYHTLRSPQFQYRLSSHESAWSKPGHDSSLTLTLLQPGNYKLEVRLLQDEFIISDVFTTEFTILPPFYRTRLAYALYAAAVFVFIALTVHWFNRRLQRRTQYFQKLVNRKTRELHHANNDLHQAMLRAEQASQAKSQFLANMSHEIRTPLNGSLGMCKLMEFTELNSEQEDLLRVMRISNEALLAIINDILDFSKVEAGEIHLESEPFSLRSLMDDVVDLVIPSLQNRPIELTVSVPNEVIDRRTGDAIRIRQVLLNLISNAVKFTPSGYVRVEVTHSADNPDNLVFTVQDSGIGMHAETLHKLFRPFSQGDQSTSKRYGGTGLGLSISKMLTEQMGGTLTVQSQIEQGSEFRVDLPLPASELPTSPPNDHSQQNSPVTAILHVPSHALRQQLCQILEQHCSVRCFNHWNDFLEQLKHVDEHSFVLADMRSRVDSEWKQLCSSSEKTIHPSRIMVLRSFDSVFQDQSEPQANFTTLTLPVRRYQLIGLLHSHAPVPTPSGMDSDADGIDPELAKSLKILLVEDNVVNQKVACLLLQRLQLSCDVASNGIEAIKRFERDRHDLILMDIQMPVIDGYEASRRILANCKDEEPPIILAITAGVMEEEKQKCMAAGMRGFIPKPIRFSTLRTELRHAFELLSASRNPR